MHKIMFVVLLSLMLVVLSAPAVAQEATPPPDAPAWFVSALEIMREASTSDAQTVNVVVIFIAAGLFVVIIVVGLIIWRYGKPFFEQLRKANERAEKAEARTEEAHAALLKRIEGDEKAALQRDRDSQEITRRQLAVQQQTAEVLQSMLEQLMRPEQRFTSVVQQINHHTDTKIGEISEPLKQAVIELKTASAILASANQQCADALKPVLTPLQGRINALLERLSVTISAVEKLNMAQQALDDENAPASGESAASPPHPMGTDSAAGQAHNDE